MYSSLFTVSSMPFTDYFFKRIPHRQSAYGSACFLRSFRNAYDDFISNKWSHGIMYQDVFGCDSFKTVVNGFIALTAALNKLIFLTSALESCE